MSENMFKPDGVMDGMMNTPAEYMQELQTRDPGTRLVDSVSMVMYWLRDHLAQALEFDLPGISQEHIMVDMRCNTGLHLVQRDGRDYGSWVDVRLWVPTEDTNPLCNEDHRYDVVLMYKVRKDPRYEGRDYLVQITQVKSPLLEVGASFADWLAKVNIGIRGQSRRASSSTKNHEDIMIPYPNDMKAGQPVEGRGVISMIDLHNHVAHFTSGSSVNFAYLRWSNVDENNTPVGPGQWVVDVT